MRVVKGDGTVVENVYDVDGVMVRTVVNGVATDLLVDTSGGLSHVVAEVDGSGAVTALYVRAGDMLLEEIRGGVAKMYETDGLASTRSLLDTTGGQTDTYSYEAFGSTVSSTGTDVNPYRFAGERWVGDVGMYQNRARWLDTRTGRFVSVDPMVGYDRRSPITAQPYLFGGASPASMMDPTGQFTVVQALVVTLVASALVAAVGVGLEYGARHHSLPEWEALVSHPIVTRDLGIAWRQSVPDNLKNSHEEGGWIYMDPRTGSVDVERSSDYSGGRFQIGLDCPPILPGMFVIADFHTHPFFPGVKYDDSFNVFHEQSPEDAGLARKRRVPALLLQTVGQNGREFQVSNIGFDKRRNKQGNVDFSGNPGYPGYDFPGVGQGCR